MKIFLSYGHDENAVLVECIRLDLRRGKLIKRDGYAHPYYWAAFILEGTDI